MIQVPVSPLLAKTILDFARICGRKEEAETALMMATWWLAAASLKNVGPSLLACHKWSLYLAAEAITDKAMCRHHIENDVEAQMRSLKALL